ncbi:unnamed protein product [Arabis nemorensis]|uniref:Uncharacterized protein n=1 Tax=Arabis nemorensis TaxID=586526 RepID=A0A565CG07_9BRAS|nr:unnamed protein product [Arabis nemorensis]
MDTSSPAAFVNGALLRRYIGQKVRAVVQVIRSDIGSVIGKSTDDQQIVVKGSPPSPLTTYLEVIGIAETDNTIRAEVWTNFGDNFDAQNYNELLLKLFCFMLVSKLELLFLWSSISRLGFLWFELYLGTVLGESLVVKWSFIEAMTELQMEVETDNSSSKESLPKPQLIYRCKKCRRIVAIEENIVPHEPGKGEQCFAWKKRSGNSEQVQCSSIFVEPMKWMQTIHDGSVEEKLLCLGCNARLGYFNWAGMQCSCGAWVNPAFQLNKSRIDECKSEPNPNPNTNMETR